jgi:hypothetical protein
MLLVSISERGALTQPTYLRALKAFSRATYRAADDVDVAVEDITNESDRGVGIISSSSVEDHLEWAIMQRMRPIWKDESARNELFGAMGTNSDFAAKNLLAYSLGIIDAEARRQIDLVRQVRNACAHARLAVSFDKPPLVAITNVIAEEILALMKTEKPGARRHAFVLTCVGLTEYIVGGQRVPAARAIADAVKSAQAKPS